MAKKKIYKFKGTEGKSLPGSTVKKWIQQHQDHHEVKAHFFGKDIIQKILNQRDCMGIRIYHAIDDKHQKTLVLVGVDERGIDLWPSASKGRGKLKDGGGNIAVDNGLPCPPWCPPPPPGE